jgi:hypothetical protein
MWRRLLSVLLLVAVGECGRRPHITASAVFLYIRRPFFSKSEMSLVPKKLNLDNRTCTKIVDLFNKVYKRNMLFMALQNVSKT